MTYPRDPVQRLARDTTIPRLQAALGDRAFTEALAEGARLTREHPVASMPSAA